MHICSEDMLGNPRTTWKSFNQQKNLLCSSQKQNKTYKKLRRVFFVRYVCQFYHLFNTFLVGLASKQKYSAYNVSAFDLYAPFSTSWIKEWVESLICQNILDVLI